MLKKIRGKHFIQRKVLFFLHFYAWETCQYGPELVKELVKFRKLPGEENWVAFIAVYLLFIISCHFKVCKVNSYDNKNCEQNKPCFLQSGVPLMMKKKIVAKSQCEKRAWAYYCMHISPHIRAVIVRCFYGNKTKQNK